MEGQKVSGQPKERSLGPEFPLVSVLPAVLALPVQAALLPDGSVKPAGSVPQPVRPPRLPGSSTTLQTWPVFSDFFLAGGEEKDRVKR